MTNRTDRRKALIAELVTLQNHIDHVDILTITGFMNDDEVAAHVARYTDVVAKKGGR